MQELKETERLLIEGRRRLSMTGVVSVDGFSEQVIKLSVGDIKAVVTGEKLKITSFNKASGNLTAEGSITDIRYGKGKRPVLKRFFK